MWPDENHRAIEIARFLKRFGGLPALTAVLVGCSNLANDQSPVFVEAHNVPGSDRDVDYGIDENQSSEPKLNEITSTQQPENSETSANQPYIEYGSGRFIGRSSSDTRRDVLSNTAEGIRLNFYETPLDEVVRAILGDMLGESYTLHPNAQANITLSTAGPIALSDILPLFEAVLDVHGLALERRDGIVQIIPRGLAAKPPTLAVPRSLSAPDDTGFGVQLVPLQFVAAKEVEEMLLQFVDGANQSIRADSKRNILIISGSGQHRRLVTDLIATFDTDVLAGMSFALFPVSTASLSDFIRELDEIFLQRGSAGLDSNVIHFVPIKRLNAILAITQQASYLDRARDWISRLDRGEIQDQTRLFVYYVQHGEAEVLADTLRQIFGNGPNAPRVSDFVAPGLEVAQIGNLNPPEPQGQTVDTVTASPNNSFVGDVRIISDQPNNALFILAAQSDYRLIEAAIEHLDIRAQQVLIEAIIAEVRLSDALDFGVQWFFESGDSQIVLAGAPVINAQGALTGPAQVFPGFSYALTKSDMRAVVNAIQDVSDVEVLSAPQLLVLDNTTATLTVGSQVPIVTQSATNVAGTNSSIVNSVELRDTGIILEVTPRISSNGTVMLEIKQEVSDVSQTTTSGIDSPTIEKREVISNIIVNDGDSIVLAGLIQNVKSEGRSGVPLLSSLPLIGELFSSTELSDDRTELMVLISPRVVNKRSDALQVTNELRQRMVNLSDFLSRSGLSETRPESNTSSSEGEEDIT